MEGGVSGVEALVQKYVGVVSGLGNGQKYVELEEIIKLL